MRRRRFLPSLYPVCDQTYVSTLQHSVLHGLDAHDANFYLDMLRDHGFNLLRIPISLAAALDLDARPRYSYFTDLKFREKSIGELLQVRYVTNGHPTNPINMEF